MISAFTKGIQWFVFFPKLVTMHIDIMADVQAEWQTAKHSLHENLLYINKSITVKLISFLRMWPKDVSTQLSPVKLRCRFRYYYPIGHSTKDDALSPF